MCLYPVEVEKDHVCTPLTSNRNDGLQQHSASHPELLRIPDMPVRLLMAERTLRRVDVLCFQPDVNCGMQHRIEAVHSCLLLTHQKEHQAGCVKSRLVRVLLYMFNEYSEPHLTMMV